MEMAEQFNRQQSLLSKSIAESITAYVGFMKEEAIEIKKEVNIKEVQPYMRLILNKTEKINSPDDALMCSILIQNYARKFL